MGTFIPFFLNPLDGLKMNFIYFIVNKGIQRLTGSKGGIKGIKGIKHLSHLYSLYSDVGGGKRHTLGMVACMRGNHLKLPDVGHRVVAWLVNGRGAPSVQLLPSRPFAYVSLQNRRMDRGGGY